MTELERDIKKYRRQTERLLLVKTDATKRFLAELEGNIYEYIEAGEAKDLRQVTGRFGTPEQIAASFFAQTDMAAVRKKLNVKRAVMAALLAALLLWGAAVSALYIEARRDLNGYYKEDTAVTEVADA